MFGAIHTTHAFNIQFNEFELSLWNNGRCLLRGFVKEGRVIRKDN